MPSTSRRVRLVPTRRRLRDPVPKARWLGHMSRATRASTVAVLVASRDRATLLARCVDAIVQQTRPADDLVVVDDGSDPPIDSLPFIHRDELPPRIVRRQTSGGPGRARNDGWRVIEADYVAITDDDCRP